MDIRLRKVEDMIEFLRFMSRSSIDFTPKNDDFNNLLYKAIQSGNVLPSWLDKLQCYVNELIEMYPEDETLKIYLNGYNSDTALRQPTEHFKLFCGPEGLTSEGLISKEMAYNFIMHQNTLRNVRIIDGTIYMNDYLNCLFGINLYKITTHEFLSLIDTLFI